MMLIYTVIMLAVVLNTPSVATAHRSPNSLELSDHDYAFKMRNQGEVRPHEHKEHDDADIDVEQQDRKEFAPQFRNPEKLLNSYSKPLGSSIRLSCPAIGNPLPNITWTYNGTNIFHNVGTVTIRKWSISMENVMPEDSGIYTCKVCNYLDCIEHSSTLIISDRVNQKPIMLSAPANLTLQLNGNGRMECKYLSDLNLSISWTFTACNSTSGCSLDHTIIKQDDGVLDFKDVTMADEGWYTCIGANSLGESSSTAYLRVVDG